MGVVLTQVVAVVGDGCAGQIALGTILGIPSAELGGFAVASRPGNGTPMHFGW